MVEVRPLRRHTINRDALRISDAEARQVWINKLHRQPRTATNLIIHSSLDNLMLLLTEKTWTSPSRLKKVGISHGPRSGCSIKTLKTTMWRAIVARRMTSVTWGRSRSLERCVRLLAAPKGRCVKFKTGNVAVIVLSSATKRCRLISTTPDPGIIATTSSPDELDTARPVATTVLSVSLKRSTWCIDPRNSSLKMKPRIRKYQASQLFPILIKKWSRLRTITKSKP